MITLIPYDPAWKTEFLAEKCRLHTALSDVLIAIEHIGSTAIPGIQAKPVIDIMIGVKDISQINETHIQKMYLFSMVLNCTRTHRNETRLSEKSTRKRSIHVVCEHFEEIFRSRLAIYVCSLGSTE